jgi:hypothetical protein
VSKKIVSFGGVCLALTFGALVWSFVAFLMDIERGEEHQRQLREEQRSGKWDFVVPLRERTKEDVPADDVRLAA